MEQKQIKQTGLLTILCNFEQNTLSHFKNVPLFQGLYFKTVMAKNIFFNEIQSFVVCTIYGIRFFLESVKRILTLCQKLIMTIMHVQPKR